MNQRIVRRGLALLGWVVGCQSFAALPQPTPHPGEARQRLAALKVPFVPNGGQWNARAAFAAQTLPGTLFVTTDGQLIYSLTGKPGDTPAAIHLEDGPPDDATSRAYHPRRARMLAGTLTETLVDAQGRALVLSPHGLHRQATQVSYFLGNDANRHKSGLETFAQLSLGELAPGIALDLRATGSSVEKIFTVAPARDPDAIRIRLGGAERLELGSNGELIAHTSDGPLVLSAPIAFQQDGQDGRTMVPVGYALAADAATYGFAVGAYDRSQPLVIDPFLQATYLGGTSEDPITAIAIHPVSGEVVVAGTTTSTDLPCTTAVTMGCGNGAQQTHAADGISDGFVARFDASLTTLLQVTYVGGIGLDQIRAMAIHPVSGEVLVAGFTGSANMPCTTAATMGCSNGAQQTYAGNGDGFVIRLNANLTSVLQATFLGGSTTDDIYAMAIHPVSGEVLVAGYTGSTDFPCTTAATPGCGNGAQQAKAFSFDGFVARLNAGLTSRLQATYFGGNSSEEIAAIAIHPVSGEVLVAGRTFSTDLSCTTMATPGCAIAAQPAHAADSGAHDGFVARLNASLTSLLQATYLGGTSSDWILGLAIHPASGEVLVAGRTSSTDLSCTTTATPGCVNGAQTANLGVDGFVARLNAGLTSVLQATYLGGSGFEEIFALAIHPGNGEVLVAGRTVSANLPCTTTATPGCGNGAQSTNAGNGDAFVMRLNAALTGFLQATYLGGGSADQINAIAVHPVNGQVLVAGAAVSNNLPCTTTATAGCGNGAQPAHAVDLGSGEDGFVARISADLTFNDNMPDPFAFTPQNNVPLASVRTSNPVHITGIVGAANVYIEGQPGGAYCISTTNACTLCDVSVGFVATPGTITPNNYVCVRHTASAAINEVTRTVLHVGGAAAPFIATTGTLIGSSCTLDVDGNGNVDALTDGLMLLRAMFGLTGTAVTNGAVGDLATRAAWPQIQLYLNGNCGTNFMP